MNLIIRRPFNYNRNNLYLWEGSTGISFLTYIIGILYFELSFINFYLLSFIAIVQIYFWISRQDETFEFSQNSFTYRFLFIKWKMQLNSFQLVKIRYDKNPSSHSKIRENAYSECLLLQNEKARFKLVKSNWGIEDYEKIKTFLHQNFSENKSVKKPFFLFKYTPDLTLFFLLAFLFSFVLTFGVFLENQKNTNIEDFTYIESILLSDSKLIKSRSGTYIRIRLQKYAGYKFDLGRRGIDELKQNNYPTQFYKNDTIGLIIDRDVYEKNIQRIADYPYFTSHLIYKKEISIKGIYYKNNYLLDQYDYAKGNSRNEKIRFFLPMIFVLIWIINIFSNKIKYLIQS